jgi:hypothetical protein
MERLRGTKKVLWMHNLNSKTISPKPKPNFRRNMPRKADKQGAQIPLEAKNEANYSTSKIATCTQERSLVYTLKKNGQGE